MVMKAKILNVTDVHLLSNPLFCREVSNDHFHLSFRAKLQGGNDIRMLAALVCYFLTETDMSVSKIC